MTRDERLGLLFIAQGITFRDVNNKTIDALEVHEKQVSEWLFGPADALLLTLHTTPINEMAIFGLQLMFFEMHGKFLLGKPAKGDNGVKFKEAWKEYQAFCEETNPNAMSQDQGAKEVLWDHGRNGLFHALHISQHLNIDIGGVLKGKLYGRNQYLNQNLISPRSIQPLLRRYFTNYIKCLKEDKTTIRYKNFEICYNNFIEAPLSFYSDATNWNI